MLPNLNRIWVNERATQTSGSARNVFEGLLNGVGDAVIVRTHLVGDCSSERLYPDECYHADKDDQKNIFYHNCAPFAGTPG